MGALNDLGLGRTELGKSVANHKKRGHRVDISRHSLFNSRNRIIEVVMNNDLAARPPDLSMESSALCGDELHFPFILEHNDYGFAIGSVIHQRLNLLGK